MYHFRTHAGQEVDIVLEARDGTCVCIEVKSSSTLQYDDIKGLRLLSQALKGRFKRGLVLYRGTDIIPFEHNIHSVPIGALWIRGEG